MSTEKTGLVWPIHRAGRSDFPRGSAVLFSPNDREEHLEIWIEGERPRAFVRVNYVNYGPIDGPLTWEEHEEVYCRISDLPEDLRDQVHQVLSAKLIPEFDKRQSRS